MAEERLIDDDKDRKYKIIKNEDGEDELVIDESVQEQEPVIPDYDFAVYEDEGDLTPEQLAERERVRQEVREAEKAKLEEAIKTAEQKLKENDFESALYNLNQVEEFAGENGEYHCLKLKILSRNFTDFVSIEKCVQASEGVSRYATEEQKEELKAIAEPYKNKYKEVKKTCERLFEENEQKKAERRSTFAELKNKAVKNLALTGVPFALFLIALIVFGSIMFSAENGLFLILTIVFASLAGIAFIFTLITLRKFLEARRRVVLNERNNTTKLGREYLSSKTELEQYKKIISSFENDLS